MGRPAKVILLLMLLAVALLWAISSVPVSSKMTSLAVLLASLLPLASTQFVPPQIILQAGYPAGFRAFIPDFPGCQQFAFHGKINRPFTQPNELGSIYQDVQRPIDGFWIIQDFRLILTAGDIIHFWTHIVKDGVGYPKYNQTWEVPDPENAVDILSPIKPPKPTPEKMTEIEATSTISTPTQGLKTSPTSSDSPSNTETSTHSTPTTPNSTVSPSSTEPFTSSSAITTESISTTAETSPKNSDKLSPSSTESSTSSSETTTPTMAETPPQNSNEPSPSSTEPSTSSSPITTESISTTAETSPQNRDKLSPSSTEPSTSSSATTTPTMAETPPQNSDEPSPSSTEPSTSSSAITTESISNQNSDKPSSSSTEPSTSSSSTTTPTSINTSPKSNNESSSSSTEPSSSTKMNETSSSEPTSSPPSTTKSILTTPKSTTTTKKPSEKRETPSPGTEKPQQSEQVEEVTTPFPLERPISSEFPEEPPLFPFPGLFPRPKPMMPSSGPGFEICSNPWIFEERIGESRTQKLERQVAKLQCQLSLFQRGYNQLSNTVESELTDLKKLIYGMVSRMANLESLLRSSPFG